MHINLTNKKQSRSPPSLSLLPLSLSIIFFPPFIFPLALGVFIYKMAWFLINDKREVLMKLGKLIMTFFFPFSFFIYLFLFTVHGCNKAGEGNMCIYSKAF